MSVAYGPFESIDSVMPQKLASGARVGIAESSMLAHDPDFVHRRPELNQIPFRPNARTYGTFAAQRSDAVS